MTACIDRLILTGFLLVICITNGFAEETSQLISGTNNDVVSTVRQPRIKTGELLVKFKSESDSDTLMQVLGDAGGSRLRTLRRSRTQVWQVPEGQEQDLAEQLNNREDILFAEPNYIYRILAMPDDPLFDEQWAHQEATGSLSAWDVSTGSTDVIIAVVDSGIDADHPDLSGKIVDGYDFVDDDDTPDDRNGHGTHIAGIAAAATNNGKGIAGMGWRARIMPIKVMDYSGSGTAADLSDGIIWAYEHGALVINLSLGGKTASKTLQKAIDAAHEAGCLVVAAMGNDRDTNSTIYPAACNNVFAVAATTHSDFYASYSQYGDHCDIAAPGGQMSSINDPNGILSTMPTQSGTYFTGGEYSLSTDYAYLQGTSMASSFVSGLAALIWAQKPAWTPGQVQTAIENTATDLGPVGWDEDFGHGRINADAALAAIADDCFGDFEGDEGDVDGADLAIWANAHTITLADSNMSSFCAAYGSIGGP